MTTYLLDTSVIIDVVNGKGDRSALLEGLLLQGDRLAGCAINVAEVYAGMRPHEAARTEALMRSLDYYDVTWEIARGGGQLKSAHARAGRTISLADALIAVVAIANGLPLMTDNVKDFRLPGLTLYPLPRGSRSRR
jgi:predicted nucleic acid-binding protein